MRLGFFGGSFDPPHLGHLAVALAAADGFALDHVLLVPTANQPLKPTGAVASYQDRLAMVSLLCRSDRRLEASDLESPVVPPAPNYTVDTLTRLRTIEPNATIFVIVGADAFQDLPRWRDPERLLTLADWIVVTRPHLVNPDHRDVAFSLPPLTPEQRSHVHLLPTVDHPASATDIRRDIAQGKSCDGLLSPPVLDYIQSRHLYTPAPGPS